MMEDLKNMIIDMGYEPPSNLDFYRQFKMLLDSEKYKHIYFDDNMRKHFTERDCLEFILLTADYPTEIYRLSRIHGVPDSVLERIIYFVYSNIDASIDFRSINVADGRNIMSDLRSRFNTTDPCINELVTTFPELNMHRDELSIDGLAGLTYINLKIDIEFVIVVSKLFKIYNKIGKWFRYDGLNGRFTVLEIATKIEDHDVRFSSITTMPKEDKIAMKDNIRYHVVCVTEGCTMYLESANKHSEALGVVYEYIDSIMEDEDNGFNVEIRHDEENNLFEELIITLPRNIRHLDLCNHFIIFYEMY